MEDSNAVPTYNGALVGGIPWKESHVRIDCKKASPGSAGSVIDCSTSPQLQEWWLNGEPHRDGGPAVIWHNGSLHWLQHGQPHRDDGPAIIDVDGSCDWWHHGVWDKTAPSTYPYPYGQWWIHVNDVVRNDPAIL